MKINYDSGYVTEGLNLNAIMQQNFEIPFNLYREFMQVLKEPRNKSKRALNFIHKYRTCLEKKNEHDYKEQDSVIHGLVQLAIQSKLRAGGIGILSKPKEDKLLSLQRTGILNGILKQNLYVFNNDSQNGKKGRIYITKCIDIDNHRYIVLFTASPEFQEDSEMEPKLKNLVVNYITRLKEYFDVSYNIEE